MAVIFLGARPAFVQCGSVRASLVWIRADPGGFVRANPSKNYERIDVQLGKTTINWQQRQ